MWKLQNNFGASGANSEPNEYIKKIGEHFVSFIHQLDQSQVLQSYQDSQISSDFWISLIGNYLVNTISQKYLKINSFSGQAERQLISDIIYIRKLISQFISGNFEIFDTLVLAFTASKKDAENKTIVELVEIHMENLSTALGMDIEKVKSLNFNEMILKSVQVKRK